MGHAMAHVICHQTLTAEAWDSRPVHMVLVVNKVALRQVFFQVCSIQTSYSISTINYIITFCRMFLMYMGQLPPAGLSLVVILKPRPYTPLVSSNSILRPIFLVLAVCKLVAALRGAGETFLVGDTVAIFVLIFSAVIIYIYMNVMKY
jgi:hypothetical protein